MMKKLLLISVVLPIFSWAMRITDVADIPGNENAIETIDLSNQGLTELPLSILDCTNLKHLNLSNNGLIKLPEYLSQLKHLEELDLSGNQGLSFVDLETLFLTNNWQLKKLDLGDCQMIFIPTTIGELTNVEVLNLAGNELKALPYTIVKLRHLKDVDLSRNNLEDISWQVLKWWGLKKLDVSNNPNLKLDKLLMSLGYFEQIDNLVISELKDFPDNFVALNVRSLEVRNSTLNTFPRNDKSTQIKQLSFINCKFENPDQFVEVLNNKVFPEHVRIEGCTEREMIPFLGLKADSISAQNNQLTTVLPIVEMSSLRYLDVRGNRIPKTELKEINRLRPEIDVLFVENITPKKGVEIPLEKFKIEPLIRTIQAGIAQELKMGKTTLDIPENGFLTENGEVYSGVVSMEYQEFMNPLDIFLSGITMTADSLDETFVFSSGGMFNMVAKDDRDNMLKVNPSAPIRINFESPSADPKMNLYALDEGGVWVNKGKDEIVEPFKIDMSLVDSAVDIAFRDAMNQDLVFYENRFVPNVKKNSQFKAYEVNFTELFTHRTRKSIDSQGSMLLIRSTNLTKSFVGKTTLIIDANQPEQYVEKLKQIAKTCKKDYAQFRYKSTSANKVYKLDYDIGLNYISDIELNLDKESDRYKLSFYFRNELIEIPVVLRSALNNPVRRVDIYKKFHKQLLSVKKQEYKLQMSQKRKADIAMVKWVSAIRNIARNREISRQTYLDRVARGDFSASVVRGFNLPNFGICNIDQLKRIKQPKRVPTDFVAMDGNSIPRSIKSVTVLDYGINSAFSFNNLNSAKYSGKSKTAILVFFSKNRLGVWRSWEQFDKADKMALEILELDDINKVDLAEIIGA
ncbi:leucine-rich repeat domain-containing protein [Crocinitomix catalasitica]|uniref:leucine-rich repeat domain-containing protein n=1 Tax=Crocinitomix catalasitica TaxID=184607 RepID=UPI000488438F|nr:leucine-rich repeat domain-containing protein [Crocinitomix catalasitica]